MTSAQVVETSVFHYYTHPDDHIIRTTDTPGFKPFTKILIVSVIITPGKKILLKGFNVCDIKYLVNQLIHH